MRILYLITRSEPGGAQVHLLELLKAFRDRAELHLAAGQDGDSFLIDEARALGVQVHLLRHLTWPVSPMKDLTALAEVLTRIRKIRPDLLHAHSSKAGFVGRLAARLAGVRSVFTAHGWAFTEGVHPARKALALALERLAGRLGDAVICVSQKDLELALRHRVVSEERMRVVWNGVPDTTQRAQPSLEPPRLVMVARFSPQKDHGLLLRSLAELKDQSWSLDLVGDGPLLPQVKALAQELGLENRVRFLGRRVDVDGILAKAQVFVLTSRWEGLPLTILEAMRAGLPVVASDVGGVGEAVVDGETGFLVPRGAESVLGERLRQLIADPGLRVQMGAAARKRYEAYFTVERMVEEVWGVYRRVLGRG